MPIEDALTSGFKAADKQVLDFNEAPRLKSPRLPSEKPYVTPEVYAKSPELQGGVIPGQTQFSTPETASAPAEAVSLPLPPAPAAISQSQVQTAQPTPAFATGISPAPAPGGALPQVGPELLDRIFGRPQTTEDRLNQMEGRFFEAMNRIEAKISQPQASPYEAGHPQAIAGNGTGNGFVSRQEMQAMLDEQAHRLAELQMVGQGQLAAWRDAERFFPDVFQNPQLKEVADRILATETSLKRDPQGPLKAAMMARGLYGQIPPASGNASAVTQRKEMLAGVGASVPEGSAPPDDAAARYAQALQTARRTGRMEDLVRARTIQTEFLRNRGQ